MKKSGKKHIPVMICGMDNNHRRYEAESIMRALANRTDIVMVGDTVMKEVSVPDIPECAHIDMGLSIRSLSYAHPSIAEPTIDIILGCCPEPDTRLRTLCVVKPRGKNE